MRKMTHAAVAASAMVAAVTAVGVVDSVTLAQQPAEQRLDTQYQALRVVPVVEGLEHPWGVAFLPDGAMLVTERPGRLQRIQNGQMTEITGLPDDLATQGQGGLLDVVLHPQHEANGWVYLTYSQGDRNATATTLIRARLEGDELVEVEQLFTQDRRSQPGRHYGSRLAFLPDGTLLMSIGDRGVEPPRAQDTLDHAGSLLRLNDDGSVPADNPFVGNEAYHPEIYSYGHRNIQGMVVLPETGEVWVTDHGPRGGDRLDRIEAGRNYGWPIATLGRAYETQEPFGQYRVHPDMMPPVHEFLPTLAPSGLAWVPTDNERFPRWQGNLLAGGLLPQHVLRVVVDEGPILHVAGGQRQVAVEGPYVVHIEEMLRDTLGRVRDVRVGPDNDIYVLTDEENGGLYRIQPAE